jgi:glycosyltransferase involved in cell wall biosynthesis
MTIGLVMIVKNEEHTLPRLAESLEGQIDYLTVLDTGSTDNTLAVLNDGIFPGVGRHIEAREWADDFSQMRNEALFLARHHGTDWLRVMDADEIMRGSVDLTCPDECEVIAARQVGDVLSWMPRLIRSDASEIVYRGRTHEYLHGIERAFPSQSFSVIHRKVFTAEKFDRDLKLLRLDLADDPYDIRAVFHLAQLHETAGELGNAIVWYKRRVLMRGDEVQAWYATWRLGACLIAIGRDHEGLEQFTEAIRMRPHRAEPYWLAAEHLRKTRRWRLAFDVCASARRECLLDADPPGAALKGDRSFILQIAYDWCIDYEQAIAAYHVGEHEIGLALVEKLEGRTDLPCGVVDMIGTMRQLYEKAKGDG